MKSNTCPFCAFLKKLKENNEYFRTLSVYKPALIDVGYYDKIDDEHCCGTATYHFNELNFCPVCGKQLNDTHQGEQKQ